MMYHDLKSRYWWYGMKRAIAEYVALCDNCQRVKAECQRLARLLQPLKIAKWKWKEISMDFIMGLPKTQSGYDSIWVIVDRLSKVAQLILVKTTYKGSKLAELYIARIVCLRGVPKKIVSDRGTQFTSKFWEKLHESMDMKLNFSSAYHPQTDGQTERINQILEDMLTSSLSRAYLSLKQLSVSHHRSFLHIFLHIDLHHQVTRLSLYYPGYTITSG
jgi:IS30 family transposase